MALVSMLNDLKKAREEGYAVPLFDVFDMTAADGVYTAGDYVYWDATGPHIDAVATAAAFGVVLETVTVSSDDFKVRVLKLNPGAAIAAA